MRCTRMTLVAVFLLLGATTVMAKATVDRKSGKCKLQEAGAFDDAKQVKVTLGKALEVEAAFYVGEFFEKKVIFANAKVKNPTKQAIFFEYHVAFFDKDGKLIGCATQGSFGDDGLAAGEDTQLGSCLITVPLDVIKQVASYQVVLYESDKPIGK